MERGEDKGWKDGKKGRVMLKRKELYESINI